jgi:hypothetical protein
MHLSELKPLITVWILFETLSFLQDEINPITIQLNKIRCFIIQPIYLKGEFSNDWLYLVSSVYNGRGLLSANVMCCACGIRGQQGRVSAQAILASK